VDRFGEGVLRQHPRKAELGFIADACCTLGISLSAGPVAVVLRARHICLLMSQMTDDVCGAAAEVRSLWEAFIICWGLLIQLAVPEVIKLVESVHQLLWRLFELGEGQTGRAIRHMNMSRNISRFYFWNREMAVSFPIHSMYEFKTVLSACKHCCMPWGLLLHSLPCWRS